VQTPTAAPSLPALAIPARVIGDEVAIYVSPEVVLVGSKSERNCFRLVNLVEHSCTCPGFVYHGACRHIQTAAMAEAIDRADAKPVLGRCEWTNGTAICAAAATESWTYADHHGTHTVRCCARHLPTGAATR